MTTSKRMSKEIILHSRHGWKESLAKGSFESGQSCADCVQESMHIKKEGSLEKGNENIIKIGWMKNRILSVIKVTPLENMFKTNGQSKVRTQMCQLQGCWNFPGQ